MARTKRPDRRVERTRQELRAALVSLMQEKGYEATTVQDILDRANVGRTTFYAHFSGKEALLEDGFDHLAAWLGERSATRRGAHPLAFSLPMFEHADEHRRLYRALVGRRAGTFVLHRIRRVIVAAAKDDVVAQAPELDVPLDALVEHVVGSYLAILVWWLDHRTGLGPAEVDALFVRLTAPVIEAARGREPARARRPP